MDEFTKIKELSDDIVGAKEPSFQGDFSNIEEEAPSPFSREPVMEMMIDRNKSLMKWHLIGLGCFAGILIIIVSAFFIFGSDSDPEDIITITATPEPVRIKPEQAGGLAIPDQDKLIYNREREQAIKIEKLFPEPEKPVLPEIMLKPLEPEQPIIQAEPEPVKVIVEPSSEAVKQETLVLPPKTQTKTQPKPQITTETQSVKKEDKVKKDDKVFWRVQLLSAQKKNTAEKAWTSISKKHKALLSNMSHDIVAAEIAGKGTFYRLQVGHFSTRDQANTLCTKLKAQKQECVPVKGASK